MGALTKQCTGLDTAETVLPVLASHLVSRSATPLDVYSSHVTMRTKTALLVSWLVGVFQLWVVAGPHLIGSTFLAFQRAREFTVTERGETSPFRLRSPALLRIPED